MADFDLVIIGNLVFPDHIEENGFLAVSDGKVALTRQGAAPTGREAFDARGLWVMPGVIDGQVHSASQAHEEGLGMPRGPLPRAGSPRWSICPTTIRSPCGTGSCCATKSRKPSATATSMWPSTPRSPKHMVRRPSPA